jgi:hypothetical protein
MSKKAGSGSASGSKSGPGSISQSYGSADPDPQKNVMDPEHWSHEMERLFLAWSFRSSSNKTGGWFLKFFRGSSDFTAKLNLVTIFVFHSWASS